MKHEHQWQTAIKRISVTNLDFNGSKPEFAVRYCQKCRELVAYDYKYKKPDNKE